MVLVIIISSSKAFIHDLNSFCPLKNSKLLVFAPSGFALPPPVPKSRLAWSLCAQFPVSDFDHRRGYRVER